MDSLLWMKWVEPTVVSEMLNLWNFEYWTPQYLSRLNMQNRIKVRIGRRGKCGNC